MVVFQHHAIGIPELTPVDRILEATKQLNDAIKQIPKRAPMDTLEAIQMLREVLLGERKEPLPPNSIQQIKAQKKVEVKQYETREVRPSVDNTLPQRVAQAKPQRVVTRPT